MREQKTESVDYPGQYMDDAMVDFQSRPRRRSIVILILNEIFEGAHQRSPGASLTTIPFQPL